MKISSLKNLIVAVAVGLMVSAASAATTGDIQFKTSGGGAGFGKIFDVDGVTPLSGSGFSAILLAGTVNNEGSLVVMGPAEAFAIGNAAGFIGVGGQFSNPGPTYQVAGSIGGQTIFYQVRAWNNQGGTVTSYEAATSRVKTGIFSATAGGQDNSGSAPFITPTTAAFPNTMLVVPEPSVLALGVVGGVMLFMRRRK